MNLKLLKIARFFHLIKKEKYNEKRQIEIVKKSPFFDAKWYLEQYPDVRAKKIGAAKHYVKYGWKEGRNPGPDFDTNDYLREYPELLEKNWCPLFHYMLSHKDTKPKISYRDIILDFLNKHTNKYQGKSNDYKLIAKSRYFNKRWYLKTYPDVSNAKMDPIEHYMKYGWKEGRNPSSKFSTNEYLELNPDVKKANINPLVHYLKYGQKEERILSEYQAIYNRVKKSRYFSSKWYLSQYPEVLKSGMNPIMHYIKIGWKKGYNPSNKFNTNFYLTSYPDIKVAGICPLVHYIQNGKKERRVTSPVKVKDVFCFSKNKYISFVSRKIFQFYYANKIKKNVNKKIAVHLHLFYTDLWDEIELYLKNLSCYSYKLYITHNEELSAKIIKKIKKFNRNVIFFQVENKGFDLGPFIYFLHQINLKQYDIIFKIHTKRNTVARNYYGLYLANNEWRKFLYDGILGERTVHEVIDMLASPNSKIGMIAHKKLITNDDSKYNKEETLRVMSQYSLDVPKEYSFVMGTMFAAKATLFQNIKNKISIDDFLPSQREVFTKAHSFERILALNVLAQNYKIVGLNTFYWKTWWRWLQAKFFPYRDENFVDRNLVKEYSFYKKNNQLEHKTVVVSSLLKEKNETLYNILLTKGTIDEKIDKPLLPNTFTYLFLLKDLIISRKIAEISSLHERTIFKLVGNDITVEKEVKSSHYSLLKIYSSSPKFVLKGTYLNDYISQSVNPRNIEDIKSNLIPYIQYAFDFFKTRDNKKLSADAWDAIIRNTIITKNKEYKFFDCNVCYLPGVPKFYFLYRVLFDLSLLKPFEKELGNFYQKPTVLAYKLYYELCLHFNVKPNFNYAQNLEKYLQISLHKRLSFFERIIHYFLTTMCYVKLYFVVSFINNLMFNRYAVPSCVRKSPYFLKSFYLKKYPDVLHSGLDPLQHYMEIGCMKGYNPSEKFDTNFYLRLYPDVAKAKINPLLHYLQSGKKEGRFPSKQAFYNAIGAVALIKNSSLFDADWYCKEYNLSKDINAAEHYLYVGEKKGYNPSLHFDGEKYLRAYPPVKNKGLNPLLHWEYLGKNEVTRFYFPVQDEKIKVIYPVNYVLQQKNKKRILLVSHLLNHTGAPILLLNLGKLLKEMGYEVMVLAPDKGDLVPDFLNAQIPVLLSRDILLPNMQIKMPFNFHFCLCNTIVLWSAYAYFSKKMSTIWWIHDNILPEQMFNEMKAVLNKAKNIYVPGNLTKCYIDPYNADVKILPYPIKDQVHKINFTQTKRTKFSVLGAICPRKGQDIFLDAINLIKPEIRKMASFELVGMYSDDEYSKRIKERVHCMKSVKLLEAINTAGDYHAYVDSIDVLVCPSREDPFPLVVIDAFMHGKSCVVSDHVGQSTLINSYQNGFVVANESPKDLAEAMTKLILSNKLLLEQKKKARDLFLTEFDYTKSLNLIKGIIEKNEKYYNYRPR